VLDLEEEQAKIKTDSYWCGIIIEALLYLRYKVFAGSQYDMVLENSLESRIAKLKYRSATPWHEDDYQLINGFVPVSHFLAWVNRPAVHIYNGFRVC